MARDIVPDNLQSYRANQIVNVLIDFNFKHKVVGWAVCVADPKVEIILDVKIDNVFVGYLKCNIARDDVEKETGFPANLGFSYEIPLQYLDGKQHDLRFEHKFGTQLYHQGQPIPHFTFKQEVTEIIEGNIDNNENNYCKGWVVRKNPINGSYEGGLTVKVMCDGRFVGLAKANRLRMEVAAETGYDPFCGFLFEVPLYFVSSRPRKFQYFVTPHDTEIPGSPVSTSFIQDKNLESIVDMRDQIENLYEIAASLRLKIKELYPVKRYTLDTYHEWYLKYRDDLHSRISELILETEASISIICPVFRPQLSELTDTIKSVLTQEYKNWQLILVDDGSNQKQLTSYIKDLCQIDRRIIAVKSAKNGGISYATNLGLPKAKCDWIVFLDHDDVIDKFALKTMSYYAGKSQALVLYSDEDKIDKLGFHSQPALKTDYNKRFLLSCNYMCHLLMVHASVIKKVGKFNSDYDGAQDHDFILRCVENVPTNKICHVPEILYSWRISPNSTSYSLESKPFATQRGVMAVNDHLVRIGKPAVVTSVIGTSYKVSYKFTAEPKITIIIPYKDHIEMTRKCLTCILDNTKYTNYDIILVDNWSTSEESVKFTEEVKDFRVSIYRVEEEFNYSHLNNLASAQTDAGYLLFLNNDVFVEQTDWLRIMVNEMLADEQVAIVGAKLLYPDGRVQHSGVVTGVNGIANHTFVGLQNNDPGYMGRNILSQEYTAVTGACMLVKKLIFNHVKGFDESLKVAFNDVDLCLKVINTGYKVVWTADVIAEHSESKSRGADKHPENVYRLNEEVELMRKKWNKNIDPFYNKLFDLDGEMFRDLMFFDK